MTTTAATAVTNLLDRIRDPGGLGTSVVQPPSLAGGQAFALTLLSAAQRYVNTLERNVLVDVPYAATAYKTCYHIDSDPVLGTGGTNPIIKVIGVQDGELDLVQCPFEQLWQSDLGWFRATTGGISHTWTTFGHDVLVIYPAMVRPYNFNVVAVPYIADLGLSSSFTVTDDLVPSVMDLAEAMALCKLGEYGTANSAMDRFANRHTEALEANRWKKPQ